MSLEQPQPNDMYRQRSLPVKYLKQVFAAFVLTWAMGLLTSCGSGSSSPPGSGTVPPASGLTITMSSALTPAFAPATSDYAFIATSSGSVQVSVNAPAGTQVAVDGQPAQTLTFTQSLKITAGQSFSFVVTTAGTSNTYYVHCLPGDFPTWTYTRAGTPQAQFYAITPNIPLVAGGPSRHYLIIVDGYGVPIWWYRSSDLPNNPLLLPNGNIAIQLSTTAQEITLNGTVARTFTNDSGIGGVLDPHELQQLSNGDYIIIADVQKGPVNLTAEDGLASAMVTDDVIEEIAPNGSLVWSWSAMDHIPFSETEAIWWPLYIEGASLADPYHMNSVAPTSTGFIVSFRHLNAIFNVDKATGNIVWKLGGTPLPQSLTFKGDPYGNFSGQHDARILDDGTITVHDNGTDVGRGPRGAHYGINTATGIATFIEQVTDPTVSVSQCCGSARKLSGGDWGIDWGLNPVVEELTASGKEVFRMTFNQPYFTYRALPIPQGVLTSAALRAAMAGQYPR